MWIADFLPEEVAGDQRAEMDAALQVMKTELSIDLPEIGDAPSNVRC